MSGAYKLVQDTLRSARLAVDGGVTFGKVLEVRMPVDGRPNGYPAKVRVAAGYDQVVCRVFHTGRNEEVFQKAADALIEANAVVMRGWKLTRGSLGTGYKTDWREGRYAAPSSPVLSHRYADLLEAVQDARTACVLRKPFAKKVKSVGWQSIHVDNGVYVVEWTVKADRATVVVQIKAVTKGLKISAFDTPIDWMLRRVRADNTDCRVLNGSDYAFRVNTYTLRLEVPIG